MLGAGPPHGGQWQVDGTDLTGRCASFSVDEATPGITEYGPTDGDVLYASVSLGAGEANWSAKGASFRLTNDAGRIQVLNTPNCLLLANGSTSGVTFTLGAGVSAMEIVKDDGLETDSEQGQGLSLSAHEGNESDENGTAPEGNESDGNVTAPEGNESDGNVTAPEGNESDGNVTAGSNETIDAGVTAETTSEDESERSVFELTLPDGTTFLLAGVDLEYDGASTFTAHGPTQSRAQRGGGGGPPGEGEADGNVGELTGDENDIPPGPGRGRGKALALGHDEEAEIAQAAAGGDVAIEVYSDADDGEPIALELGHVTVQGATNGKGAQKAQLNIEAPDGSPGAVVLMHFDAEDLGNLSLAEAAASLTVLYDGEPMAQADDLADVRDWSDEEEAEYLLLVANHKVVLMASIPHFSPHSIELVETQTADAAEPSDTPLPALMALVALSLAAVAVNVVRRP